MTGSPEPGGILTIRRISTAEFPALAEAPGLRSHPGSPELPGGVVRAISRTCSAAVFAGLPRLECQAEKNRIGRVSAELTSGEPIAGTDRRAVSGGIIRQIGKTGRAWLNVALLLQLLLFSNVRRGLQC
jgi:hypothetical protein